MPSERWQHAIDACHAILSDIKLPAWQRAFYWLRIANAHCWRNELHRAAHAAHRALAHDPANAEAHVALARILIAQGRVPQAVRHYATAAELNMAWYPDALTEAKRHGFQIVPTQTPRYGYAVRAA